VIDVHSHLLPGVDDGPKSWDAALDLCRAVADDGVTISVATPHVIDGVYPNTTARVAALVRELNDRAGTAGIPLTVLPGGEVSVGCGRLVERWTDDVPTLAGGRHLLLELPVTLVPHAFEQLVFSLRARGVTPVVAHPERCLAVQRDVAVARAWRRNGALLQVDAESLLGLWEDGARRAAIAIVGEGLVHLLASDAHSCRRRPPRLAAAARVVADVAGPEMARFLVDEGPRRVVEGSPAGEPPAPPARRGHGLRRFRGWIGRWRGAQSPAGPSVARATSSR
jgi:protein-tyrosine phosphatase